MGMKIAIDGPSGSGKSSVARTLAGSLGFVYIDTGAMYRAVALAAGRAGVDWSDETGLENLLENIDIGIQYIDGAQRIFLGDSDVTEDVRTAEMGVGASKVSVFSVVRKKLVDMQRSMAQNETGGVVMDGRDIGTVVLPDADFKIFLTANADIRALRRCGELEKLGLSWDFDEVVEQINQRDFEDSNRVESPLRQADDAVVVDTSRLTVAGAVGTIEEIIEGGVRDV